MKDEYLKAYQQRIEEIKTLDVSPEEKRKLAADAKSEILEQYKNSYIEEEKNVAKASAPTPVSKPVDTAPANVETKNSDDPIDSLLNKFEERDDRGEVGIELAFTQESMESDLDSDDVLDPESLFETMNLGDLLESLGIDDEDDDSLDEETEISGDFDDMFMDINELFAGLGDEEETEEAQIPEILQEFDLNSETQPIDNANAFKTLESTPQETQAESKIEVAEDKVILDSKPSIKVSLEAEVDEIEELKQGVIVEGETLDEEEVISAADLDAESIEELKELEKERERAQKLGVIEMALLVVLIILVIIVVRLYINIGV